MDTSSGAMFGPIIDIETINDLRMRATSLWQEFQPYLGCQKSGLPSDLCKQIDDLARDATAVISHAIMEHGNWYQLTRPRNYYALHTQRVWLCRESDRYLTYGSRLSEEPCEIIWDPNDWPSWSPPGVKRDFVTWYGAPDIVCELAAGGVLDDLAGIAVREDELPELLAEPSLWGPPRVRRDYPGEGYDEVEERTDPALAELAWNESLQDLSLDDAISEESRFWLYDGYLN